MLSFCRVVVLLYRCVVVCLVWRDGVVLVCRLVLLSWCVVVVSCCCFVDVLYGCVCVCVAVFGVVFRLCVVLLMVCLCVGCCV